MTNLNEITEFAKSLKISGSRIVFDKPIKSTTKDEMAFLKANYDELFPLVQAAQESHDEVSRELALSISSDIDERVQFLSSLRQSLSRSDYEAKCEEFGIVPQDDAKTLKYSFGVFADHHYAQAENFKSGVAGQLAQGRAWAIDAEAKQQPQLKERISVLGVPLASGMMKNVTNVAKLAKSTTAPAFAKNVAKTEKEAL